MKTITVTESTHRKLVELKKEGEARTFDELLEGLIEKEMEVPKSLFGKAKGFSHARDHKDRTDRYA
ncbi:MAG: hypothetical protein HYX24_03840 [Candidatus Aenigmarchaeota archaeon]|nr:hypothetical protein [Candidatus Aenigmarchaeota archaeon]